MYEKLPSIALLDYTNVYFW